MARSKVADGLFDMIRKNDEESKAPAAVNERAEHTEVKEVQPAAPAEEYAGGKTKRAKKQAQSLDELFDLEKTNIRISSWITQEQADRLEALTKILHISKSNLIRTCLISGMNELEERIGSK